MVSREEELLTEILMWTKFMARPGLSDSLTQVLKDPRHKLAYEATDGNRTQTEVGKVAGLDQTTVSELWQRWRRLGLLNDTGNRPARLISLIDLGWDLKALAKSKSQT
jgi:hypothetical protein